MARQVLPIAGAIVGTFFGQPQLGFAIGSMIGNIVDPQRIRGPGLKELPVMGVTEGAFRQVAYGTTVIRDCQLIDWGDLDAVIVEEQQGKGGGPVVESQRLYQTYAVAISEPIEAVRYIKRNGVMVYDVRPGSTILDESAEFLERCRIYLGDDTQLPDPDLEALPRNGVGNTPAYRGTSYFVMVRDDLTDLRGQIPTYEVEVLRQVAGEFSAVTLATDVKHYKGSKADLQLGAAMGFASGFDLVRVSPNGLYAAGSARDGTAAGSFEVRKYDEEADTWSPIATPAFIPVYAPRSMAWSPDSTTLACGTIGSGERLVAYRLASDVLTKLADPADPPSNDPTLGLCWDSVGGRLAIAVNDATTTVNVWDFVADAFVNFRTMDSPGTIFAGGPPNVLDFLPGAGSRYLAGGNNTAVQVFRCEEDPVELAAFVAEPAAAGAFWDSSGRYLIGVDNDTVSVFEFTSSVIDTETLDYLGDSPDVMATGAVDASMDSTGRFLAIANASSPRPTIYAWGDELPPEPAVLDALADAGADVEAVSWTRTPSLPQYEDNGVLLSAIVADICDRCGIPSAKLDLSQLTDVVKGMTLGGAYDGAGAITTLMPAFLFDLYSADRELIAQKRGAAVKYTLTVDDLLEEPDENMLRGQGIEYPRALQLKYLNPGQNYAAPATTVTNKTTSARVLGEVQIDLPVSFDETEALNVATRMLKVMWEDVNGEAVFSLPAGPFAWLTPTDCLGLVLRGATYRIRVEKVEATPGQLKITARRDRQSAYTSELTAIPLPAPTPPPPSLAGITTFVPMNIPGRVDEDDRLGFVFGICGLPGTAWRGANVAYRVAGETDWVSLGNYTTRAVIGQLTAPLAAASEFFTDTTNTLSVQLIGDDELESLTDAQLLSEGNPAAIVYPDATAEIVQFRDVDDIGSRMWDLTHLLRGRLATVPGPHLAGAFFVPLDGTQFVTLPSALIGANLQFRVTSLGTSPEVAPVYDFTWNPVHSQLEFAPLDLVLARSGGNISGTWTERRRFGTEDNPIASINFEGYRVTLTDGVTTSIFDSTIASFGTSDAAFSGPITVTVQQLNRFTGPGPGLSEVIA